MLNFRLCIPVMACASLLASCGNDTSTEATHVIEAASAPANAVDPSIAAQAALPLDTVGDDATLSAVIGASDIPYPVYPNGSKYRIGGENGLKIVVFATEDSFEDVDGYYKGLANKSAMPRLMASNDYVRYSSSNDDKDPWATYRPGIVIHKFNDDSERSAVGADKAAKTNIIMSF